MADAASVGDNAVESGQVVLVLGELNHTDAGSIPGCFSDEVPDGRSPLSSIMHSLKSYTANRANELLGRSGPFWQRESYDHWIRNLDELERIVEYVIRNPVSAGRCARPKQWKFSSACDRFQQDGSDCGLVGWLRDDWLLDDAPGVEDGDGKNA